MRINPVTHINANASRSWLIDLCILSGLLLFFYFLWLGTYPLFTPDEGRYSEVAREMIATGDFITPRVDGVAFLDKPILYYWLQAAAMFVFGINEWAIRIFPALLGIFGCLVTYTCGRVLFNRRTGLLAASILATTPLYFGGAHYADLNLEVAVFISTTLLFIITGIQSYGKERTIFFLAAYVFAALAFLTKGLIGLAFPALVSGSWILLLSRFDLLKKAHLITGLIIFIFLTLPWYILVQKANPTFLHYFFVTQQVTRFLSAGEFNNKTPIWFYLPIILIGAFPWTTFIFQAITKSVRAIWQDKREHSIELFLLLWLFIVTVFFSIPKTKTVGYILPVFPAMALLIGNYLSLSWEKIRQKEWYVSIVIFVLMATMLALLLFILPIHDWLDFSAHIKPYFTAIAILFLASAGGVILIAKQKKLFPLYVICLTLASFSLMILIMNAKYLNNNTAKPLILSLQKVIKPEDEVITYYRYFQDVPLYLKRRVSIVADWNSPTIAQKDNWVRELWFGMPFQNTKDWLIGESTFWQRWQSKSRIFVFVNANYFDAFKKHANNYFYLGQNNDIILLSNHPTFLKIEAKANFLIEKPRTYW